MDADSSGILPSDPGDVCFVRLWIVCWAKVHEAQKPFQPEVLVGYVEHEYFSVQHYLHYQVRAIKMKSLDTAQKRTPGTECDH